MEHPFITNLLLLHSEWQRFSTEKFPHETSMVIPLLILAVTLLPLFLKGSKILGMEYIKSWFRVSEPSKGIHDIPGPFSLPLLGATWMYSRFGQFTHEKYHESNDAKYALYGPVVREEVLFNFPLIHLFEKADIDQVLRNEGEYPMRPPNEADVFYRRLRSATYLNDGMVNLNGPDWHNLRGLLTPPLTNRNTLKNYSSQMNVIADDLVGQMYSEANPETHILADFKDLVYRAGLETVSTVALDRRMGFLEKEMKSETLMILESIQGYQSSSNEAMYGLPWWKYVPTRFSGVLTNLVRHKDNLCQVVGKIVDEALADEATSGNSFEADSSILRQLLKNPKLDLKDVKASTIDYITAGVDTIGNSIIFAIGLIAQYPEIQRQLQEELEQHLRPGEDITPEKIFNLKYLRACITESFRMYPTASQIARILPQDTEVTGGYILPQFSVVLCHTRLASLQDQNFTRAKEFRPERWLDHASGDFPACERSLVLPFGVGRRACPGKRLAEQEIHIMVAKIFLTYSIALVEELEVKFNFLLTPHGKMALVVRERIASPHAQEMKSPSNNHPLANE